MRGGWEVANKKPPLFVRKATGLVREISVLSTIPLSWLCIGAGINVFAIQSSFSFPGANVPLGYFITGILYVIFTASLGLMAVAMPRTGGDYVSTSRVLGPFFGILSAIPRIIGLCFVGGLLAGLTGIFVGTGLIQAGTLTENTGLTDLGTSLVASNYTTFAVGVIIAIIALLILLTGSKTFSIAIWVLMIVPLVGSLVGMGLLYANTQATAKTAWDNMFGSGAWDEIVNVANANGWTTATYATMNWDNTFKILIPAYFAYGGSEATVYWGGEVKEPTKSMLVGMIVGPFLMLIFYSIFVYSVFACYGTFVSQCAFVMMQEDVAAKLTINPTLPVNFPMFASVLLPQPWFVVFVSLTSALWLFGVVVLVMGMVSKLILAMAFDRFVPEGLAAVNDRFHSPHWALILSFVFSLVGLVIFVYWGALAAIIDTTIIWFLWSTFLCMAATIYPLTRREIWEKGYPLRVLGFPVISILGIISFAAYAYVNTAAIKEASSQVLYVGIGTWVFALIYYAIYALYNRSRGVDVEAVYREIPPA